MDLKPLVSVIIPVYNVEPYLEECINSVLVQTYTNLQIILVDDGSTDNCPKLCDEYAQKDNRIFVIHQNNTGLSGARNTGMNHAKGEWWTFVDSDDIIHPQMIESLMNIILTNNCEVAACRNVDFFNINNLTRGLTEKKITSKKIYLYDYMGIKYWSTAWGKIYNHKLFEKTKYPLGRLHEDEFTTYKLLYNAKNIFYCPDELYFYRLRKNSITANIKLKNLIDINDALQERLDFFNQRKEEQLVKRTLIAYSYFFVKLNNVELKQYDCKEMKNHIIKQLKQEDLSAFTITEKIKFKMRIKFPQLNLIYARLIKNIKK